jgi:glycosyltransferase involved in cell wall biosynthesis
VLIDPGHHSVAPSISKPEMKLLVLAQTPPPLHGQSVMVQALVEGLPKLGVAIHHVNLRLSQDTGDIGRWRIGKIFRTVASALSAIRARFASHCDTLYYVPAPPGKRGALYRDWVLMLFCRPFFRRCVLHWHAVGLGEWLQRDASVFERIITRQLLGRAHLAIVLGEALRADAQYLKPRRVAVIPNGIPTPSTAAPAQPPDPYRLLFLGMCSEEKGLFAAASAVLELNRRKGTSDTNPAFALTAAGPFDRSETADRFHRLCGERPNVFRHAGTVTGPAKSVLFAESHALVLPTRYPAEGMPLVTLEALAHDRPVVATNWRALIDVVTPDVGILVAPGNDAALTAAIIRIRDHPPAPKICRARFLAHFTLERHLAALAAALLELDVKQSG